MLMWHVGGNMIMIIASLEGIEVLVEVKIS